MSEPEFNHSTENWSIAAQKIITPTSGTATGNLTVTSSKNIILNSNNVIFGRNAAQTYQGTNAIALGLNAGNSGQGTNAIAIGTSAGYTNQGSGAIAIGYQAGQTNQHANSIVINAQSATGLPSLAASSFYVAPIRNYTQSTALGYDATNKEITYYNQNASASISGLPTSITTTANATLTINFNNSYTSVTNYSVSSTNNTGASIITINNYQFSNAIIGAQYTIGITLTNNGSQTTQWTFLGQGASPPSTAATTNVASLKTNFSTISTTAYSSGTVKYFVLTIAYDGSSYYMAGSLFA
jgi:hypothetical protein